MPNDQDLDLRIRLKADGSGLVGEFRQGEKVVRKFGDAADDADKSTRRGSGSLRDYATSAGQANIVSRALGGNVRALAFGMATFAGLGTLSLAGLASAIISVNSEFQKLEAQLRVITGSQAAASAEFDRWRDFAAETPSQISEIVDSFIRLRNFGLRATERDMKSYSNTAAATGKTLNQFIEAVADASTLEFERLKEFGILARQETDTIRFTFQGVTTEIAKDSEAIQDYLRNIGETAFAGSIEEQMKTIGGAASNLKDAFAELLNTMGEVTGLDNAATTFFERMARGARVMSDMLEETDIEKQQRLFDEMLALNFKLQSLEGSNDPRAGHRRSKARERIEEIRAELGEVTKIVNESTHERARAHERMLAQEKATREAKAAEERAQLAENLDKKLTKVIDSIRTQEELENQAYQERLNTINAAEAAGVEAVLPYQQLRERLLEGHLDTLAAIEEKKAQERIRAENERRQLEREREREERRKINDNRFLEVAAAQGYLDADFDKTKAAQLRKEVEEQKHQDRLRKIRLKHAGEYGGIVEKFVDLDRAAGADRAAIALDVGEQITGAAAGESKKAFELQKKLRIGQAIIAAYTSISNAYAELPYPANIAASVAIGALAFANVRNIQNQKFQGGRMFGGSVAANGFVEVGEHNRPELFKQDGKLLLFPGNRGGEVIPFDQTRRAAGSTVLPQSSSPKVVVNLYGAPEGARVEQRGNEIDVIWPQVQDRLGQDLVAGADWVRTGETTYGWNRGRGARVRR